MYLTKFMYEFYANYNNSFLLRSSHPSLPKMEGWVRNPLLEVGPLIYKTLSE